MITRMSDLTLACLKLLPFVSCTTLASVEASYPPTSTENIILVLKLFFLLFISDPDCTFLCSKGIGMLYSRAGNIFLTSVRQTAAFKVVRWQMGEGLDTGMCYNKRCVYCIQSFLLYTKKDLTSSFSNVT